MSPAVTLGPNECTIYGHNAAYAKSSTNFKTEGYTARKYRHIVGCLWKVFSSNVPRRFDDSDGMIVSNGQASISTDTDAISTPCKSGLPGNLLAL